MEGIEKELEGAAPHVLFPVATTNRRPRTRPSPMNRTRTLLGAAACALLSLGAAAQPRTVTVRMLNDGTHARFDPAEVTVHAGDRVRFVNVQGGPHNVSFDAAKLTAAARATLTAGMPDQIQPLWGALLTEANQAYTIPTAGLAPGRYEFFCMPHQAMGMKGVLVVTR